MKGNIIVGQSGGPTAVINSSAYGVIRTALQNVQSTRAGVTNALGSESRPRPQAVRPAVEEVLPQGEDSDVMDM